MTTPITDFNVNECDKLDARLVNAYIDIMEDPENPTGIILDHSWGLDKLDLKKIIKAGETVTSLSLYPVDKAVYLRFLREDGKADCIHGDNLSRIISMQYLKDVDQATKPADGDVYIFHQEDDDEGLFQPFNLQKYMDDTAATLQKINGALENLQQQIDDLDTRVNNLTTQVNNHETRIKSIETTIAKPEGIPDSAVLVWGNINLYSDHTNSNKRDHGLYTHSTDETIADDDKFA